ncbi:MAG TPA: RNA-guided pseudouridylation complex pseudouridine synthase subunit Cbf5 [Candidatus Nanoarchaeia archaeon]|nr:RNA-guided pseudouridylation complex pseudouridine synthase subunit Cbf5 [Candidatus Nanoarchaeia archaeon]
MSELPFEKIKREVLIRKESVSSPKFGVDPWNRPTLELLKWGVINIDKPSGPSSHQVSAYVKEILGLAKSGHSGTLDPKVTGCLPVALDRATRVVQSLLPAGKEYICLMHIHQDVVQDKLRKVLEGFVGRIKQLPPKKSAVKRQSRFRTIYYLDVLEIQEKEVLFKVGCQAGTYIRKLVHDIGMALGCGAHMSELRRTKAGPFKESSLSTLQNLKDAYYYFKEEGRDEELRKLVVPIEFGVSHLAKVWVLDTTVDSLCHGATLGIPGVSKVESEIQVGEDVAVLTLKGELVAVGKALLASRVMLKDKGLAVKSSQVFMDPGVYPKMSRV